MSFTIEASSVGPQNYARSLFWQRSLQTNRNFSSRIEGDFTNALSEVVELLAHEGDVVLNSDVADYQVFVMVESFDGDASVLIECDPEEGSYHFVVAGVSEEKRAEWAEALEIFLVPKIYTPPPVVANRMPLNYWMMGSMGPENFRRTIDSQPWFEIRNNYPAYVASEVDEIADMTSFDGGKLILLNGQPGTGKTRAMLGLVETWRSWSNVHVITDPERFFGQPSYMISVMMGFSNDKWNLLVVEDGDEFMDAADSGRKDQAVGRLLNLNDGFIGQGLNVATLISTNVDLSSFNSAVTRPGRCLANIEFPAFEAAEATAWLSTRDVAYEATEEMTLAEMFDLVRRQHPELIEPARFSDDESVNLAQRLDPWD
jgi:hypothetical protein